MYSEQDLAIRLHEETGYSVTLSPIENVDQIAVNSSLPLIFVGHLGIKLKGQEEYANAYRELDNEEILITEINYLCQQDAWPQVRQNIKKDYFGWSPFPNDADFSSVFFMEAMKKGNSGSRVWWSEIIGLIVPRIS
jgi:hypothetical protein